MSDLLHNRLELGLSNQCPACEQLRLDFILARNLAPVSPSQPVQSPSTSPRKKESHVQGAVRQASLRFRHPSRHRARQGVLPL